VTAESEGVTDGFNARSTRDSKILFVRFRRAKQVSANRQHSDVGALQGTRQLQNMCQWQRNGPPKVTVYPVPLVNVLDVPSREIGRPARGPVHGMGCDAGSVCAVVGVGTCTPLHGQGVFIRDVENPATLLSRKAGRVWADFLTLVCLRQPASSPAPRVNKSRHSPAFGGDANAPRTMFHPLGFGWRGINRMLC